MQVKKEKRIHLYHKVTDIALEEKIKNVDTYFECAYIFKGDDGMILGYSTISK